jgi:hypothetical protein
MAFLLLETGGKLLLEDGVSGLLLELGVSAPIVVPIPEPPSMNTSEFEKGAATVAEKFAENFVPQYPWAVYTDDATALIWLPGITVEAQAEVIGAARALVGLECRMVADAHVLRTHHSDAGCHARGMTLRAEATLHARQDDDEVALILSLLG